MTGALSNTYRARTVRGLCILALSLSATGALAQSAPSEIEAAKKVAAETANRALTAFESGKYEDAITGFEAADKSFHAPKFLLYVARAQAKLGRLVAAKSTYEGIVKEKLASYAPREFFDAQAAARKELAEVTGRIPTLRIVVKGKIDSVTVDGATIKPGDSIPLDPGDHTIAGKGKDTEVKRVVKLTERESRTETLEASNSPPPQVTATASVSAPPMATETPSSTGTSGTTPPSRGIPTATYAAFGAGAVGLVVGAVFGGLTLAKKSEFDEKPTAEVADLGEVFSHVADVGFGVAIAGAAVGTIVWVISARSEKSKGTALRDAGKEYKLFVMPRGTGLSVGGTF